MLYCNTWGGIAGKPSASLTLLNEDSNHMTGRWCRVHCSLLLAEVSINTALRTALHTALSPPSTLPSLPHPHERVQH